MSEILKTSPSQQLYEKLLGQIKPNRYDVHKLAKRTVYLPHEGLMGPVVDTTGSEFLYT